MTRPTAAILVIIDGLADIPGEGTSKTHTLTNLARRGRCGLIDPVSPGLACGSDTAHLSIFGYDPHRYYRGRGAFEALGANVSIKSGDIAFKCNFAILDSHGIVTARCPGKGPALHQLAEMLCTILNHEIGVVKGVRVMISHAGGHRCTIRLTGEGLSDAVSNTDPLRDNLPLLRCRPVDIEDAAATLTAGIVNCLSDKIREVLACLDKNVLPGRDSPAVNAVLLRGAAMGIDLKPFEKATGLKTFLIAPTKIIAGVGHTAGMDVIPVQGATGGYDTNLMAKAEACVEHLMKEEADRYAYDLGIVHVKAVDESAHDKNAMKKAFWLEQVDLMIARILRLLTGYERNDVMLCVTGDHTTPSAYGDHTCEPVPFVVCDVFDPDRNHRNRSAETDFVGRDECKKFQSAEMGANGSLGRFPGSEISLLLRRILHKNGENGTKSSH